jgi:hypothetical protein
MGGGAVTPPKRIAVPAEPLERQLDRIGGDYIREAVVPRTVAVDICKRAGPKRVSVGDERSGKLLVRQAGHLRQAKVDLCIHEVRLVGGPDLAPGNRPEPLAAQLLEHPRQRILAIGLFAGKDQAASRNLPISQIRAPA